MRLRAWQYFWPPNFEAEQLTKSGELDMAGIDEVFSGTRSEHGIIGPPPPPRAASSCPSLVALVEWSGPCRPPRSRRPHPAGAAGLPALLRHHPGPDHQPELGLH
jgi:hypothetical protein